MNLGRKMIPTFCGHKKHYATRKDAVTMLNTLMGSRRGKRRKGRPEHLEVYHCPRCNGWHLTHHGDE